MPPNDPTLRLLRLALAEPDPSPELRAALAELLPPRRVRKLLGPWNDRRLALAVLLAETSLKSEQAPSAVQLEALGTLLGIAPSDVSALFGRHRAGTGEKYPDGPHAAALAMVGEVEGLSWRAIHERIAKAPPDVDGLGFGAVRAALGLTKP